MLHIPALWYFDIYTHGYSREKHVIISPCLVLQEYLWNIALQLSVGGYNVGTNLRCSGCRPQGQIIAKRDYTLQDYPTPRDPGANCPKSFNRPSCLTCYNSKQYQSILTLSSCVTLWLNLVMWMWKVILKKNPGKLHAAIATGNGATSD